MRLRAISLNTIPDEIIRQVKELITNGHLKPGERLPNERDLGEQWGVGRSSVREAMIALAAMGVVVRTREGTYVNPNSAKLVWCYLDNGSGLTRSTIRDVLETRRLFEVGIAGLAAERATPETIAVIRQCISAELCDIEGFKQADVHFHAAIARATENFFICDLYGKFQETLFQTHHYYTTLERLNPRAATAMYELLRQQHQAILDAIEAHDSVTAQRAMLAHFESLEMSMLSEEPSGETDAEEEEAERAP